MSFENICCPHCNGSGRIEPGEELRATLRVFSPHSELAAEGVCSLLAGVKPTAMSNRLRRLMEAGYLTRRKDGKYWLYSLTKKGGR